MPKRWDLNGFHHQLGKLSFGNPTVCHRKSELAKVNHQQMGHVYPWISMAQISWEMLGRTDANGAREAQRATASGDLSGMFDVCIDC